MKSRNLSSQVLNGFEYINPPMFIERRMSKSIAKLPHTWNINPHPDALIFHQKLSYVNLIPKLNLNSAHIRVFSHE